jgi:hypothetical protein
MARGGDTSAKARANGKPVGRPPKPKIESKADKSVANEVLAMDGPPDHIRDCDCRVCAKHPKNCDCEEECGDCRKLKENCECATYRPVTPRCAACRTLDEHRICHCEHCRWWRHRLSPDKRISYDADVYLTNRRDGKPAESITAETSMTIHVIERNGTGDSSSTKTGVAAKTGR